MVKTMQAGFLTVVWASQLCALSGCAVPGENISKKGLVTVERVSSPKVDIPWADVYRTDKNLMVRGMVCRRASSSQPLQVHVDVTVLARDDRVLQRAVSRDIWVASRSPSNGSGSNRFEVHLPIAPSEGNTVRVVCHAGSRDVHCQADNPQNEDGRPEETARNP